MNSPDLRTAAQQALEALEAVQPQNMGPLIHPAKQALRAALAKPVHPSGFAYRYPDGVRFNNGSEVNGCLPSEVIPYYLGKAPHQQQAEPVAVAERERIAAQWDGCVTHQLDTFGPVDIGESIRAGELVGPAQQAEPLSEDQEQRMLRLCPHYGPSPARNEWIAGYEVALAQQAEPTKSSEEA